MKENKLPRLIYPCGFELTNGNPHEKQKQGIDWAVENGYLPIFIFNNDINNNKKLIPIEFKEGIEKHPTYKHWVTMLLRCYDKGHPDYEKYGGKNISVKTEWINSFEQFCKDMEITPKNTNRK